MKIEIDVPRTFDITLKQLEDFLIGSGWDKQPHNDNVNKFQCKKYPNVYAILPKIEGGLLDEEYILFSALRLIANINNNCGIETIINRVIEVDTEKCKYWNTCAVATETKMRCMDKQTSKTCSMWKHFNKR